MEKAWPGSDKSRKRSAGRRALSFGGGPALPSQGVPRAVRTRQEGSQPFSAFRRFAPPHFGVRTRMPMSPARVRRAGNRAIAMIANTPPAPLAPPATATPPPAIQYSVAEGRSVCRALQLYRCASLARGRGRRGCRGEPQRCLETHGAAVPGEARVAAEAALSAAHYNRVDEGSGNRWFKQTYR